MRRVGHARRRRLWVNEDAGVFDELTVMQMIGIFSIMACLVIAGALWTALSADLQAITSTLSSLF